MLRLPDPEDVADFDVAVRGVRERDDDASPVADLSERRARNPLFRQQPTGRTEGDEVAEAPRERRRAARPVSGVASAGPTEARDGSADGRRTTGGAAVAADAGACTTCPFGVAMLALDEVQPDARDHLLAASRELLAAARTVLESLEHTIERQQRHPTASRGVQHVRVRRA